MDDDKSSSGSPEMNRNPSPPPEEDEESVGEADAIGETVYSKHWLFSTLTHLIEVYPELSEQTVADVHNAQQTHIISIRSLTLN